MSRSLKDARTGSHEHVTTGQQGCGPVGDIQLTLARNYREIRTGHPRARLLLDWRREIHGSMPGGARCEDLSIGPKDLRSHFMRSAVVRIRVLQLDDGAPRADPL